MEKRGLGRGLSALIPEVVSEARQGQIQEILVSQIVPNPYQPRTLFDPLKMEDLVASVREHGILQPILLRATGHERYQLVAGERRFRAAQAVGLTQIPALVRTVTDQEQLEIAVVENLQREDIGAMEAARAYARLANEFGMTQDRISQRVGKSRSAVANTMRLLHLPEAIQESLERGEITEGHARALLMIEDIPALKQAWETVVKRKLSVRDTERLAREVRNPPPTNPLPSEPTFQAGSPSLRLQRDPHEMSVTELLQQALGTKVTVRRSAGGSGRLEIEFYSEQELEGLIDLILGRKGEGF